MADLPVFSTEQVARIVRSVLRSEQNTRNDPPRSRGARDYPVFGIVRGKAVSAFTESSHTVQIYAIEALGQSPPNPSVILTAVNVPKISGAAGDTVYAIYNYATKYPGTGTIDWVGTGTGTGEGNWEIFPTSEVRSSSGSVAWGMVIKQIEGATFSGTTYSGDFGFTEDAVVLLQIDTITNGFYPDTGTGTATIFLDALWKGKTVFEAGTTNPIITMGYRVGTNKFVIGGETDLRSNTGYDITKDMSIGKDADGLPEWQEDTFCGTGT